MKDNKRRRIFYIDRIFQKKLMVLFLGLNLFVVIANILYYFIHLKGILEDNLFRSHIQIDNISQVLAGEVLRFNIFLTLGATLLVLLFYSFTRVRLQLFFDRTKDALAIRQGNDTQEIQPAKIHEEFQEVDHVLNRFFEVVDCQLEEEKQKIAHLKEIHI